MKIFLSYRRIDTQGYAHAIYNILASYYGSENVFMDLGTINPGADFKEIINTAVKSSFVFLALIGPSWVEIEDEDGTKRIFSPSDFVRLEIAEALQHDVYVVPLLVQGASMPSIDELPENIFSLTEKHAYVISNNLVKDVNDLIELINSVAVEKKVNIKKAQKDKFFKPKIRGLFIGSIILGIVGLIASYMFDMISPYTSYFKFFGFTAFSFMGALFGYIIEVDVKSYLSAFGFIGLSFFGTFLFVILSAITADNGFMLFLITNILFQAIFLIYKLSRN